MLTSSTFRNHWPLLAFGWLMTFGSSIGQTYFISIFGGLIRNEFELSHAAFGGIYSIGTLGSAAVLMWAGRMIDRRSLLAFSGCAIGGLALAAVTMAVATGPIWLIGVFFLLRFFGQGLMTHAAMTAMGRYFTAERGRAVSFAALGHVTAQATLPILAVSLLAVMHWRSIWIAGGAALLLVLLPLVVVILKRVRLDTVAAPRSNAILVGTPRDGASLSMVLRDSLLYCLLPALMAPSFISTGLIFHQIHIGAEKGWSLELLAIGLSVFAVGSFAAMLLAGWLVDRLTSRRVLPFSLMPLALACLMLATTSSAQGGLAFFVLLGAQSGLALVVRGAVWAEIYGVSHLGAIRAFTTSAMVFASGLAPAVVGALIHWQWSVEKIALLLAAYCVLASALTVAGLRLASLGR